MKRPSENRIIGSALARSVVNGLILPGYLYY
jgi:hypothetical protein